MPRPTSAPTFPVTPQQLVTAALVLQAQIASHTKDLAEVEAKIVALGSGRHPGLAEGESVVVVGAAAAGTGAVSYTLPANDVAEAKKLAGPHFGTLFDRRIVFDPCPGFGDVAPKLLSPARARAILELCKRVGRAFAGRAAYVKY